MPTSRSCSRSPIPAPASKGISRLHRADRRRPATASRAIEHKLGQHASDTAQIVLRRSARSRPTDLLGAEGQGYRIALSNLEGGRIGIAAQAVGMAQRGARGSAALCERAHQLRRADLRRTRRVAFRLADMATCRSKPHASWCCTPPRCATPACRACSEASMAKLFASEMAERVCSDAIQMHGGYGYLERLPGRAHLPRRAGVPDLRGHQRHPAAGDRARADQGRLTAAPRSRHSAARSRRRVSKVRMSRRVSQTMWM